MEICSLPLLNSIDTEKIIIQNICEKIQSNIDIENALAMNDYREPSRA